MSDWSNTVEIKAYPHCDPRVLHPPGECVYCDESGLQQIREVWGIAYTGGHPPPNGLPCPADHARPGGGRFRDGESDHRKWPGNRPSQGDPDVRP